MSDKIIPPTPKSRDYTDDPVYQKQADQNAAEIFDCEDPFALFGEWMLDARAAEPNDGNAMSLATVDANGLPDVRIVLLKAFDENGFVFYTNLESAKGRQLANHPKAAISLHWKSLRRQIRARGHVVPVSAEEADAYFASRARGSQIGAWASDQSRPVSSRAMLESRVNSANEQFEGQEVPRPDYWGGWRIVPEVIEFWRDRPFRLHDRLVFKRSGENWDKERLFP